MLGKAIYHILNNDATLTGFIGNRIYPTISNMATEIPMVVYTTIATVPTDYKQAASDIDYIMMQIDIFGRTALQANSIADRIRTLLDRYTPATVEGIHLTYVSFRNQMEDWNDADKVFRIMQEYQFRIRREL